MLEKLLERLLIGAVAEVRLLECILDGVRNNRRTSREAFEDLREARVRFTELVGGAVDALALGITWEQLKAERAIADRAVLGVIESVAIPRVSDQEGESGEPVC